MYTFSVNTVEDALDEVTARVKEIVPKRDLDCTEPRSEIVIAISESKHKIMDMLTGKTACDDETVEYATANILYSLKDVILDGAAKIKGEGQDEGNLHGSQIEDIADELIDFAEEEYREIIDPLLS